MRNSTVRYLQHRISNHIMYRKYGQKVLHDMLGRPPSPLSPHPFVEIGLHVLSPYTSSHFLAQFQIVPTRLYFLCVNSSPWVHEIATMHHNLVCANVVYLAIHVSVSCPVVSVDFRSGSDASIYNGVKSGHIPSIDYRKVAPHWTIFCGYNSKHPLVSSRSSSSVVLKNTERVFLIT